MSRKHFSWLLVLTFVVAALILLMPAKTGHESAFEVRPLIPGMDKWVNEVKRVRVVKPGKQTVATLVRGDKGWVVEEADSYPADWAKLKNLLANLAQAQVIEPKTANPAYFDRLGLKSIDDSSSGAVELEIGEGEKSVTLLIGHSAQGRDGQYVRMANGEQALLIDRALDVSTETPDWLDRSIVDLAEDEVVEVTISHPDGDRVNVSKKSADDKDFTLQGLPQGREIQSSWSVNALGGSLSGLQLDGVAAESQVDWSQASHLWVLTADGLELAADLAKAEDKFWIRLVASAHESAAATAAADAVKENPDGAADPASQESVEKSAAADLEKRVETINQRVSGWAYAIPQYKFDVMNKSLEDLLKPLEKADDKDGKPEK